MYFNIVFLFYIVTGWKSLSLSMISIATAMLCKEQGITVAGVCVLYELFITQKVRNVNVTYYVTEIFC